MEILGIKNLSFCYPEREKNAINNVSLSVDKGEFVLICGESGCGKSTLLRLIKREISPFGNKNGEILYKGIKIEEINDRTAAQEIGFVLQNPESQIVTDSVWHELAFGLESLGLETEAIRRRVAEIASYFGIENWFYKRTDELSGGQKQLLNLASVMVMQPEILLLDEPTAQLDPIAAANFIATLQKLNRELGLTILLIEHRLEDIFPVADRVLLMESGEIGLFDKPSKMWDYFKNSPAHPMAAGLPAAMRVFGLLDDTGESPVSVRQGRNYIIDNYENRIDFLPTENYNHSDEKVVELKNIRFRYQKESPDVIRDVSLSVYKGEHFCIVGGNGSGKTTTLGIISGLLKPYSGKVIIKGKRIKEYSNNSLYRKNIALLPQNPQTVFLEKTVMEDLLETANRMKYPKEQANKKISELAETLQIGHLMEFHPYDLSGGEQQRAALAKILIGEPEILLLDEPTKGIDAYQKHTLAAIIANLKQNGVTVVSVTHDTEFAAAFGDRCAMVFGGEITSVGGALEFFAQNNFYTTAANRISRGYYKNAVLCEQVAELCRINGKKEVAE